MKIIALDPGGKTGIATYKDGVHEAFDLRASEAMPWLDRELRATGSEKYDLIVSESIRITQTTGRKSQDVLISIEQIGISRWLSFVYGVEFKLQAPSEAKNFSTDDKLRLLDWWTVGSDHARDASRHLILALAEFDPVFRAKLAEKCAA